MLAYTVLSTYACATNIGKFFLIRRFNRQIAKLKPFLVLSSIAIACPWENVIQPMDMELALLNTARIEFHILKCKRSGGMAT